MKLRREDVAYLHVVVYLQRLRDDVRSVKFLAYDTAADCVAIKTNKEIEQSSTVADNKFPVAVYRA